MTGNISRCCDGIQDLLNDLPELVTEATCSITLENDFMALISGMEDRVEEIRKHIQNIKDYL